MSATAINPLTPPTLDTTTITTLAQLVRAGSAPDYAAATLGVTPNLLATWTRKGRATLASYHNGRAWNTFNDHELLCATLTDQLTRSEGEWEAASAITLESLSRPRTTTTTKTTTKNGQEPTVETTVREVAPDARIIQWRLAQRLPKVYGSRSTLDVNVNDPTQDDEYQRALTEQLLLVGKRLLPIEATATEVQQ
jgi:hypothetical protein